MNRIALLGTAAAAAGGTPTPPPQSAAATEYISRVEGEGGAPSDAEKAALHVFFLANNDFALLDSFYLHIWNVALANAVDIATVLGLGRSGSFVGTVTQFPGYSQGDGIDGYFSTNTRPSASLPGPMSGTNSCLFYYSPDQDALQVYDISVVDTTDPPNFRLLSLEQWDEELFWEVGGGWTNPSSGNGFVPRAGIVFANASPAAMTLRVRDASGITTAIDEGPSGSPNLNPPQFVVVGMANNTDGVISDFSSRRYAAFGAGLSHTPAEETAFLNSLYAFFNACDVHQPPIV